MTQNPVRMIVMTPEIDALLVTLAEIESQGLRPNISRVVRSLILEKAEAKGITLPKQAKRPHRQQASAQASN